MYFFFIECMNFFFALNDDQKISAQHSFESGVLFFGKVIDFQIISNDSIVCGGCGGDGLIFAFKYTSQLMNITSNN